MKTSLSIFLASILASSFLFADKIIKTENPVAKAVVLDNTGNPTNSVANKAVKLKVADEVIDPNDSAAEKVIKGKAVRGDYRTKRKIRRETNH
jgi:hypothetical protein